MREIWSHYGRISRRREDVRILDLEERAKSGKDEKARVELSNLLRERAEANDTTIEEELAKVRERKR